jgi:cell division protease FtsH
MFVGVGAGRVRDMFRKAKQSAPCLVFIDEIDAVGRQRGAGLGGGNDEREQTLNQLLVEMDGFEDNSGIIVIAATNREDVLDPALLRAGRFDRTITVNLPDKKGREAIFKVHARNKLIDPKVNWESLAKRTVGFSGADIENILNEAAILAVRGNKPMVTVEDIDEAIDRRIAGPAKSSKGLNEHERKQIAYHEAGHAIIGLKLEHSDKVQKITIIPRGRTGGHVLMTPEDDRFLLSKAELEARIVGYLGGRSSEEIFFEDVSTGASNDIEVATRIARSMVTEYGMSSLGPIQYERDTGSVFLGRDYASTQKNFSTQIAFEIDQEVRKIIEDAHKKAREIILANKKEVTLIAETLLEKETITAEEIEGLLKGESKEKKETEKKPAAKKPAAPKAPKVSSEKPVAKKAAAKKAQ